MARPDSEVSDRKFAERLERQANDGHGWNKVPDMLREAARRLRMAQSPWVGPGVTFPCGCRSAGPQNEPPWYCEMHNKVKHG